MKTNVTKIIFAFLGTLILCVFCLACNRQNAIEHQQETKVQVESLSKTQEHDKKLKELYSSDEYRAEVCSNGRRTIAYQTTLDKNNNKIITAYVKFIGQLNQGEYDCYFGELEVYEPKEGVIRKRVNKDSLNVKNVRFTNADGYIEERSVDTHNYRMINLSNGTSSSSLLNNHPSVRYSDNDSLMYLFDLGDEYIKYLENDIFSIDFYGMMCAHYVDHDGPKQPPIIDNFFIDYDNPRNKWECNEVSHDELVKELSLDKVPQNILEYETVK